MTAPEAPAAPSRSYTPIVTDVMRLVRAPFSPGAVYGEQQERPTFWWPWVIVSVVWAVLQFLQRPFQARLGELVAQRAGRPVPAGGGTGAATYLIGAGTSFLTVLVLVAISAGILYLLIMAFGAQTTYKKMLTVVIFTWPIAVLQQLLTYVVLSRRGVASITSAWDMVVSFGADLMLPSDTQLSAFWRLFLAGIGPLQIWSLAITAIGLMVLAKAGKGTAWTAATISYLLGLAIGAGIASFGMKMAGG